jgi:hypothetical protein
MIKGAPQANLAVTRSSGAGPSSGRFVISLDFEMFWGVAESRSIAEYGQYVRGVWDAIPQMLTMFRQHGVRVTWATVGMIMCHSYDQWREIEGSCFEGRAKGKPSSYLLGDLAREYPELFFGRDLVERVRDTDGQEIGSHTFSHFYCGRPDASIEEFAEDLALARAQAMELGIKMQSLVFPRNQVVPRFLDTAKLAGFNAYRGNPSHWLYRHGHQAPMGEVGRALRLLDACLPLSGQSETRVNCANGLMNVPASHFLRPWSPKFALLYPLHVSRLKVAMTAAAISGGIFHLWWHPHNFGCHLRENLAGLSTLLGHFQNVKDKFGMCSGCMRDLAEAIE